MCCCDEDVIALLCVGIPAIVYAAIVGFPKRYPTAVAGKLKSCSTKSSIKKKNILECLRETKQGRLFLFIMIVAIIFIIYGIVVGILRCLVCCCSCCCGCLDCFLKYAYRIGVSVGFPALIDFLTYLISVKVAEKNNWFDDKLTKEGWLNNTIGGYNGLSMVSLACGWVFTIVIGSFFIQKDSYWLKFLGLILRCVVSFLIIAIIVPCDPYKVYGASRAKWAGVVLGLIDVAVFTGMYAAALCCLGGCCCK